MELLMIYIPHLAYIRKLKIRWMNAETTSTGKDNISSYFCVLL